VSDKRINYAAILLSILLACKLATASEYQLPSGEILKDPTRPMSFQRATARGDAVTAPVTFTLNYILTKGQDRRAMINGKKVLEGDQVSGATVKRIDGDKVVISYQGNLKELRLNKVNGIQRN
jgi:hypothetical protein